MCNREAEGRLTEEERGGGDVGEKESIVTPVYEDAMMKLMASCAHLKNC